MRCSTLLRPGFGLLAAPSAAPLRHPAENEKRPRSSRAPLDFPYFQSSESSEIKRQLWEEISLVRFELEQYQTATGSLRILLLLILLLLIVLFAATKETAEEAALFLGLLLLVRVLGVLRGVGRLLRLAGR